MELDCFILGSVVRGVSGESSESYFNAGLVRFLHKKLRAWGAWQSEHRYKHKIAGSHRLQVNRLGPRDLSCTKSDLNCYFGRIRCVYVAIILLLAAADWQVELELNSCVED